MIEFSAQDLTRTILCDQPGCALDAEIGRTVCREHLRPRTVRPAVAEPFAFDKPRIIAAIRRWAREHEGVPPRSSDWHRSDAYWPNMTTVCRLFGKWGDALEQAGFDRNFHVCRRYGARAVVSKAGDGTAAVGTPSPVAETVVRVTRGLGRIVDELAYVDRELARLEREIEDELFAGADAA